jgi:SAM-dependent methyltransferase
MVQAGDFSVYQCPATRKSLVQSDSGLSTEGGRTSYTLKDGVPNFLLSQCWQTPKSENLQLLLDVAKKEGFKGAVDAVFEDARYVMDPSRAAYLSLLPIDKETRVLEIGASLGQHTRLIAAKSKRVAALEVIPEQALFTKLSCEQDGITNVSVSVGGDDCNLPYKDGMFDVVIMNYVLEWSAGRSRLSPKASHQLIIKECCRVLRSGGILFLSTKNRFNVRLLLGALDEHVGFRFGNALPRWVMKLGTQAKPYSGTPGYLHSYGALRRIISSSGFRHITPKLALPDARFPMVYSGFSKPEITALRSDQKLLSANRLTRFLLTKVPGQFIRLIAPSLVFIAQK